MELNDLLEKKGIDPKQVISFRHQPREADLNRRFPWLAAERPDLFNAYQQSHGSIVEKAMTRAFYIASFIGHKPGRALFIGLYSIGTHQRLTRKEYWKVPANIELRRLGMEGFHKSDMRQSVLWFNLSLKTDFFPSWKGKLIVGWPGKERSWWRRAHRNKMPVLAILEDSALTAYMPRLDEIALSWDDLKVLPTRWRDAIAQWRAVYYIVDVSDGRGYVGSAYGAKNLCYRWENYAASGHGGNSLLKKCDPKNFRFTILERVSPDMDAEDIINLERTWKKRLHTRAPFGLNDN